MNDYNRLAPRVFISYSHQDRALAESVCAVITRMGLEPLWDEGFAAGRGFHEQIKMFIAHAHIFLPIITESSSQRGWVHQEIGYAVALHIPVLPVARGELPSEMLRELHAVVLTGATGELEAELERKLTRASVDVLLKGYLDESHAYYETAPLAEDRTALMTQYANQVQQMGKAVMLRQKGGLSSMQIPDEVITHPVWIERYGQMPKGTFHCRGQRGERMALEHHARAAGFKLLIDPSLSYDRYGAEARKTRLGTLIQFLSSLEGDPKYQVAFCADGGVRDNVTILGDWFYAESVSPSLGSGYRQTIFTRHAPSMQAKIDLFDREFAGRLEALGWKPEESRDLALATLRPIAEVITT